jgi:osmotically inducible lipoprotein OsmB
MKSSVSATLLLLPVLVLGACGTTTTDRAVSGGLIGTTVGVVGGLVVGAPLEGALIGAGVGTVTGILTDEDEINLGRPIWR